MTNYESIKSMNMLQLAHFLFFVENGLIPNDYCINHCVFRFNCNIDSGEPQCTDFEALFMDWLNSESTINYGELYYGEKRF